MGLTAYDWRLGSLRWYKKRNHLYPAIAYTLWLRKPTIMGLAVRLYKVYLHTLQACNQLINDVVITNDCIIITYDYIIVTDAYVIIT